MGSAVFLIILGRTKTIDYRPVFKLINTIV